MKNKSNYNCFQRIVRVFKLNFLKLLRSPGGAKKVSLGFAIGFGLEMLVISTASLIYILFIPLVKLSRGSLPSAIIGNVIGKLSFLPLLLLPFARRIGKWIYPMKVKHVGRLHISFSELLHLDFHGIISVLQGGIHILIGMSIFGLILGFISYFVVYYFYEKQKNYRLKQRVSSDKHI
ncbi:DUF2062 domain-containing protein [Aneurinibacillus sp. Ricciae_BoGa-3]|uniref:DUF2062 domain-containing protein n=1 Tax=Aneurinibacillus sp. Ricciae_BoGa-3 TaxID=3022697 RepID=UPI002340041F|nr:DUF2062 domain-containing protein [Aneurinibacillus sp. Ricciae_BoGa-3]WCK54552.1 DUF2062 domain-containing protein [Aneurinibacillus sp. Ricciae_BoGa-3]